MNVTMRYRLSDAGQRAALLAGRPATAQVVETMETTPTAELLAACQITPAGSAELVAETYRYETLHLDAPPESVEHLARLWEAHQAAVVAGEEARAADAKKQKEELEAAHLAAIDRFLEGPRGEFTWDVTPLEKGDCIQGGGFSQNSRGKRKNESEFFAVVVERTETEIVISEKPTLAAALKVAR